MKKHLWLLSGLTALMLAGCSSNGEETGSAKEKATETEEVVETETATAATDKVKQTEPLVVYLNDFDELIEPLFEEKTGYDIELVVGNGAEVQSRIEAEKSNPNWDVVWLDGQGSFARWENDGILLENVSLESEGNLNDFGKSLVPASKAYYPTGAHAAGVIVYNTNEVKAEDAPKTWADLTNPAYKNMVGMADPAIAAPAYPFVAWFFEDLGMDGGKEYFTKLFENGTKVFPKNPNVVEALLSGDLKIAALQESNAYKMKQDGEPIEIVWPEEGAPASVRYAAISKDTDQEEVAKAFISFILEKETQDQMIAAGTEGFYTSSVKDVASPAARDEKAPLLIANPATAAQNEAEVKEWFADQSVQ
ncbi:extracellular solute-binding protein [Psychrobacillus sp. NPDC096426]|uniref:extracellular solute-binding protein n=1 Tax=Psychrobacillus sp. NPDC096426 TaxID=3364491 RepID=UPI003824FE96